MVISVAGIPEYVWVARSLASWSGIWPRSVLLWNSSSYPSQFCLLHHSLFTLGLQPWAWSHRILLPSGKWPYVLWDTFSEQWKCYLQHENTQRQHLALGRNINLGTDRSLISNNSLLWIWEFWKIGLPRVLYAQRKKQRSTYCPSRYTDICIQIRRISCCQEYNTTGIWGERIIRSRTMQWWLCTTGVWDQKCLEAFRECTWRSKMWFGP